MLGSSQELLKTGSLFCLLATGCYLSSCYAAAAAAAAVVVLTGVHTITSAVTHTRCRRHTYRSDSCALPVTQELANGTDATSSTWSTQTSRLLSVQRQIFAAEMSEWSRLCNF